MCLVPAAIGTAFFHGTLAKDANVFLMEGRPRFSKKDGSSQSTMVNTMVVVFGATDRQRARFAEARAGSVVGAGGSSVFLHRTSSYR